MADDLDLFAQLPHGSYEGVVFAVLDISIETGSAGARHQFPYRPGQKIELTGREPVTGSMTAAMFNSLTQFKGGGNNGMFPAGITVLRQKVQSQKLGKLVIPTFGTIERAWVKLSEKATAIARNGVYITLRFEEDSAEAISQGGLPGIKGSMAELANTAALELAAIRVKFQIAVDDIESTTGTATDLLSSVQALNSSLQQIDDDLNRPARQAEALVSAINDLVETSSSHSLLTNPGNWAALNALLALRDAVASSVEDTLKGTTAVIGYTVKGPMSVAAIAKATSNSVEDLLKLNVFDDPYDVLEGEVVLVYDIEE